MEQPTASEEPRSGPRLDVEDAEGGLPAGFDALYDEHFAFVWRSLKRLGVPVEALDDAVQDVFMVALRRRADFRGQSSERTWLFGIAHNVAHEQRRKQRRASVHEDLDEELSAPHPSPLDALTTAEALRFVRSFLETLDEERRAVFVMMELEQMPAPEVARALGVNLNTVYSRRRAARLEFLRRVERHFRRNP
jgi:RNA polymerase sigma-70 factor (ECF subfamily)